MRHSHRRCCTERKQPSKIQRMTNVTIDRRGVEYQLRVLSPPQEEIDLSQSEQIEMIQEKSGDQDKKPAFRPKPVNDHAQRRVFDVPYNAADRPPLQEH